MSSRKPRKSRRDLGKYRFFAIRARRSGMSTSDIARVLSVHPNSVSRWFKIYRDNGAAFLRPRKSSGRPRKIECKTFSKRLLQVVKKSPKEFGFETELWNSNRIRIAIEKETGVSFCRTTIWKELKNLGLSYQTPKKQAFEADEKLRKKWLKTIWPRIRARAKKERAVVLFEDEAAVTLTPHLGKTWAKISRTPTVKVTGKRSTICVISAISPAGKLLFKIPKKRVNSAEFIDFMKQILREIPRKKIYLVADRAPSHIAKATQQFAESSGRLHLLYLPPYSPDFNPDEFVWHRLKNVELQSHSETTKDGLRLKTLHKMKSIQKRKKLIKSFCRRTKLT